MITAEVYQQRLISLIYSFYRNQNKLIEIETRQTKCTSSIGNNTGSSSGPYYSDGFSNLTSSKVEIENRMMKIEEDYILLNREVAAIMRQLPERKEQQALCYYFFQVPTYATVLRKMQCNDKQYHAILSKAKENFDIYSFKLCVSSL